MKINRRTAIASLGALIGLPTPKGIDVDALDDDQHAPESTPGEIVEFCAGQELRAIRFNHPAWWQKLRYSSIVQCAGVAVVFGVGPAWYCQSAEKGYLEFFGKNCEILATHHTPGYRSWAAVVTCNLSDGVRREVESADVETPIEHAEHIARYVLFSNEGVSNMNERNEGTEVSLNRREFVQRSAGAIVAMASMPLVGLPRAANYTEACFDFARVAGEWSAPSVWIVLLYGANEWVYFYRGDLVGVRIRRELVDDHALARCVRSVRPRLPNYSRTRAVNDFISQLCNLAASLSPGAWQSWPARQPQVHPRAQIVDSLGLCAWCECGFADTEQHRTCDRCSGTYRGPWCNVQQLGNEFVSLFRDEKARALPNMQFAAADFSEVPDQLRYVLLKFDGGEGFLRLPTHALCA